MAGPIPFFLIPSVDQRNDTRNIHIQPDLTNPKPASSNRGRKPSKAPPPPKKLRRRGMGVAQLEKIINNRTTTELNPPIIPASPFHHVHMGVPLMVNNNVEALGGLNQGFENATEFNRINPGLGQFWSNPYVFGAPFATSGELSSMPKLIQRYDQSCCKKKFVNGDECLGHYNGSDFQRLSLDNKFGAFFPNNNNLTAGGAEVVTVHRKMEAKGRNFFMEYEFFPDKNKTDKNDTYSKDMEMVVFQNSKAPPCLKISDHSAATTTPNSVDLSLKLSF